VIVVSYLIIRAAAIALMMTGMEEQRARFQALSAFSGTGFTTREAEFVVNHPQRRQIMTWLMVLGNAGIVTVIVSATSSIVTSEGFHMPITIAALVVGIFVIYKIMSRQSFIKQWEDFIQRRLLKWHLFKRVPFEDLFILKEDHGLMRVIADKKSPLLDDSFIKSKLERKAFFILGIERGNKWLSLPAKEITIDEGDRVILYGQLNNMHKTFKE
jgi:hypothetical protein